MSRVDVEDVEAGAQRFPFRGLMRFTFRVSGPGAFRVSRFGAWCVSRFAFHTDLVKRCAG